MCICSLCVTYIIICKTDTNYFCYRQHATKIKQASNMPQNTSTPSEHNSVVCQSKENRWQSTTGSGKSLAAEAAT